MAETTEQTTTRPELPSNVVQWAAFKESRPNIQADHDWAQRKIPEELRVVQQEASIPDKLKEILAWSLVRRTQATPNPAHDAHGKEPATTADTPASERHPTGSAAPIQADASVARAHRGRPSVSDSQSVHSDQRSKRSSSVERKFPRLRQLKAGVVSSTLDLLATLKDKTDREAATTTRSEAKAAAKPKPTTTECTSCFEEFPVSAVNKLSCTHSYCKPCLSSLVLTALQNESSYPPKCCLTAIPLPTILSPLDPKQRELYREKAAEYAIPAQDRWYCPNRTCLKWIPPTKLQRSRLLPIQKCPHCSTKICKTCRGVAHEDNVDCPQDFGLSATIAVAESEGWQRCFRCRTMVEVC